MVEVPPNVLVALTCVLEWLESSFTDRQEHPHAVDVLMLPSEAAATLWISRSTLNRLARRGEGPPVMEIGPRIRRYRRADVLAYLSEMSRPDGPLPRVRKRRAGTG